MQPIGNAFCHKCGWTFTPIFDPYPKGDKDHLFIARSLWNAVHETDEIRLDLEKNILKLESLLDEKSCMVEKLKDNVAMVGKEQRETKSELEMKIKELECQLEERTHEVLQLQSELMNAKREAREAMDKKHKWQRRFDEKWDGPIND